VPNQYIIKEDGSIKMVGCLSPPVSFPPWYTNRLASLVEALKVEGYWKDGFGSICNSNKPLIDYIQRLLQDLSIHVTRSLIVRVKIGFEVERNKVKVFKDGKPVKFHIQNHQIGDTKVRRIAFRAPYATAEYTLKIGEGVHGLFINIRGTHVQVQCRLPAFVYINLQFRSLTFSRLLRDVLGEKGGKKSRTIRLNELLEKSPPDVVMAAFSMVIDCEGSIDCNGLKRRIRIRMTNRRYLEDWLNVLNSLGIHASLFKDGLYGLCITGIEDFGKMMGYGFELHHSVKRAKFQKLLNSYKRFQVSRNSALNFYQEQLKKVGHPITAQGLASIVGKSKRVVSQYLKKLSDKGLIFIEKSSMPYLYSFF
jgi:hypothetical protein